MFCKNGVLKIFAKIHWKTPVLESLFNKRDSNTSVFQSNLPKISRVPFFTEHLPWLLLFVLSKTQICPRLSSFLKIIHTSFLEKIQYYGLRLIISIHKDVKELSSQIFLIYIFKYSCSETLSTL